MALPNAFLLNPPEASMVPSMSDKDVLSTADLKSCLHDTLTSNPQVQGLHKVTIAAHTVLTQVSAFKPRAIVPYFTGKLPALNEIAGFLDRGFQRAVVDKVFYNGSGLYEVLFLQQKAKRFLSIHPLLFSVVKLFMCFLGSQ
ncbi:hypothetical protein GOP47_0020431 [Adiantum capillus-veneris]|uniref:Uncharacterized protein n=1 Tax=Adiantum capillus-veneris TaxID=13818 RepID=A0A9D4UD20_ADICA|nr:hypothetical protein GOP47_0020431 [Adiantum capillus-veneris]